MSVVIRCGSKLSLLIASCYSANISHILMKLGIVGISPS
jgi:hypothetical protein